MAISYPLTIPNHDFASITMRMKRVVGYNESTFTLEQQVYEHQGARWEAEITLPPMTHTQAREWQAFFIGLKGRRGTFIMGNPLQSDIAGTATAATLNAAASVRATSITVDGSSDGTTILAGDYFQIGSGDDAHIHQVVEDATFASGSATLTIEPPLRATYANNTSLDLTYPKGVWRLASNEVEWNIGQASLYGFTFACIEAL